MNVFEKIREKLEETKTRKCISGIAGNAYEIGLRHAFYDAIEIVDQVEEEYGNPTLCYLCGPCEYQTEDVNHNNGWIPVGEERYPDTDRYILISFANFSIPVVGRYKEDEEGGAFYCGDEDETLLSHDLIVNAWMELPKPYRN